MKDKDS